MRAVQWVLQAAATWLILAAILPEGSLLGFVAGLVLLLAATAVAITTDNQDIRFGRGRTRQPIRTVANRAR